ncbi:YesL family protein [Evansella tamaricis]|uniref:DUF624 domain-containing protein n=1 Tax=Evansella tamaricis TaxID=2069301 RepID=A0ABS6JJN9_9BACI|nr:DUF624 domain-containing protein [Evansella tamaricis]MBU9713896.1 DUF624 domain-containing protein [Evansella tamaricis]
MGKSTNVFFRVLEIFTNFLVLNILWIIFCIPVITIFSSTAAMVGVTRKWLTKEIDYGVFKPFFQLFKENLKQGIGLQFLWIGLGMILITDFYIVLLFEFPGQTIIFGLTIFASIIYLMMSVYLFPLMVNYHLSIRGLLKNSLFLSIGSIGTTFLCLLILLTMGILSYYLPFMVLVFGSILSFVIFSLCNRIFEKHKVQLGNYSVQNIQPE